MTVQRKQIADANDATPPLADVDAGLRERARAHYSRRLSEKLRQAGVPEAEIPGRVESLLRREVPIDLSAGYPD